MTTYRTGNAIGSADPRDLYDNAENLDELVNSQDKAEHPDRLGVPRKTWHGMEQEHKADQTRREDEFVAAQSDKQQRFNLLLANSGYEYLADYAAGIEITEYNQVLRDAAGELWRAAATTTLPYTTDGTGLPEGGAFVAVGDADIRNDLAAGVGAGKGGLLVRGAVIYVDTVADLQALDTSELVDGQQVQVKEYHAGTGVGGGEFYYDPNRASENDGGMVLDGFVRVVRGSITPADFGAVEDGSAQNQAIQAALSNYHHVQIDRPYWVDATDRLLMSSDQTVDFVGDGKLMALPNSAGNYAVLSLREIENSTLNHPVIQGDKYTHTGTSGEWGMCLSISSVKNVTVNNPILTDAWGDCLYIGRSDLPSENLVINNPVCQRGRRQGISLVAGVGVTINNPVCEDIRSDDSAVPLPGGPHAGIDIEPNTYLDRLEDIRIINPTTRRCEGVSLLVALNNITTDQPEGHYANVGISVVGHTDEGSYAGARVAYTGSGRLWGSIVFDSPTYRDSRLNALVLRMPDNSAKVTVVRPVIIDHNRRGGSSSNYDAAIFVGVSDSTFDGDIGGLHIINPKIVVNTPTASPMYGITVRNANNPNRRIGVDIEDIEVSSDEGLVNQVTNVTRGLFTSKDNSLYRQTSSSQPLSNILGKYVEGASETSEITLTLTDRPYGHPDQHIRRASLTQALNVRKPVEGTLLDMDGTPIDRMRADSQYAYVQLRPLGDGAWVVVSRYGTWTTFAD